MGHSELLAEDIDAILACAEVRVGTHMMHVE